MRKESDFSNALLKTLKPSKKLAYKEGKENMIRFGGEWHVVQLGDRFTSVHKHYLKTHNIKSIKKIKNKYALKVKWYYYPLYPIYLLFRSTRWLA